MILIISDVKAIPMNINTSMKIQKTKKIKKISKSRPCVLEDISDPKQNNLHKAEVINDPNILKRY